MDYSTTILLLQVIFVILLLGFLFWEDLADIFLADFDFYVLTEFRPSNLKGLTWVGSNNIIYSNSIVPWIILSRTVKCTLTSSIVFYEPAYLHLWVIIDAVPINGKLWVYSSVLRETLAFMLKITLPNPSSKKVYLWNRCRNTLSLLTKYINCTSHLMRRTYGNCIMVSFVTEKFIPPIKMILRNRSTYIWLNKILDYSISKIVE